MDQLRDALQAFGWTKYEAACYSALVRAGAMKASRVASEADIMQSKIYQPLSTLEEKGYVKITDENPKIYEAQNPKYVMEQEERRFNQEKRDVLEKLQEGWEIGAEAQNAENNAWVVQGREGLVMELSRLLDNTDESIKVFDSRLVRAPRDVVDKLADQADEVDVQVVAGSQSRDQLHRLQKEGADVRERTELMRSAYYIFDDDKVLLNLSGGRTSTVVEDTDIVTIISQDFEDIYKEASEVSTDD